MTTTDQRSVNVARGLAVVLARRQLEADLVRVVEAVATRPLPSVLEELCRLAGTYHPFAEHERAMYRWFAEHRTPEHVREERLAEARHAIAERNMLAAWPDESEAA